MKKIINPNKSKWQKLCKRPSVSAAGLEDLVNAIFKDIKKHGDRAVKKFTRRFDKVNLKDLVVDAQTIAKAAELVNAELKAAITLAKNNIEKFHSVQQTTREMINTSPGVTCWREDRPIEKVGIYIPGGTAPLFSTVLMLGIPAKIAGCNEIILCTPPDKEGMINPAILYAASLVGVTKIIRVGGIQAIGALSIGTNSIPKVDKIFGPGNQFVTAAKQLVQKMGTAIDMPAGPSEILVIADHSADPAFVAADLLSQAEHGTDSQVILLSNNDAVIDTVLTEVNTQCEALPRKKIAAKALHNSKAIVFKSIEECLEFSNAYAPEHLVIATDEPGKWTSAIQNAGSVFLGKFSCEAAGDYASGTNHTLPTNGYARSYSGVSLESFVKKISFQSITEEGILAIGPSIELMAEAEQLFAHKNAVSLRLKKISHV